MKTNETFNINEWIVHHIRNSQEWHIPFIEPVHFQSPLSLHAMMVLIAAAILVILFCFVYRKDQRIPTGISNAMEFMIVFIRDDIVYPNVGKEDGRRMMPLFCTLFFFILSMNLMGLIPLFSTATGNINVTFALAVVTLTFMIGGAVIKNGLGGFFKGLIPSGVPWPILIVLFPIEFLSLFTRAFALMVRLFANMMAGHIVIFAILGLIVIAGLVALPAVLLALMIYIIEILVSFLQAYIFTLLSAIFIGQTYHPDH